MTKKIKGLLTIISVFVGIFMSLSAPMGGFLITPCADAVVRPPPAAPEPLLFSVLALIGLYFISRNKGR